MYISGSGEVGIGTTAPEQLLHLKSEAPFLDFTDSSNNSESGVLYRNTSGTNVGFALYDFGNNALKFRTNNSLALTIDYSQPVGIGVSPSYPLHVENAGDTVGLF